MSKKSVKGFIKTRHFQERQKQRNISDKEIAKIISSGTLIENELGDNFTLNDLKVSVDLKTRTLVTVHPKSPTAKSIKILSQEEAKKIQTLIEAHKNSKLNEEALESNEFLAYVKENGIKKID